MHTRTVATILAATLAGALLPALAGPAAANPCPAVINVAVEGTGSVGLPNTITKAHTGPDAIEIGYPGSMWPNGAYTYDQSVSMGVAETKRVVREQHARCPDSTIRVVGHSQGARVAGDAVEELAAEDGDIGYVDVLLLSDPRRTGTGVETVIPFTVPGYRMMGERGTFGNARVTDQCAPHDPICDFPQPLSEPAALLDVVPNYFAHHGNYVPGVAHEAPASQPGPALPHVPQPALPSLPPLPNFADPYTPTPLAVYIPDVVEVFIPAPVLAWVPPPLPTF